VKVKQQKITAVVVIVLLGFILQKNYINEFPSHIHAWAQSDRYAIAKGFVNNGLNLSKPETFVLNHQFPGGFKMTSKESITSVDFPIHEYIVAAFMKTFGSTSPWLFRTYTLLYSFLGLFFLFKLAKLLTGSFKKAIFVVVIAATSPVFVYYQNGFLPTIPSLSNAIIGLYFYFNFSKNRQAKYFIIAILFLTVAALNRTTFLIPLIAVVSIEFVLALKRKSIKKYQIVSVSLSMICIVGYVLYNNYLRALHGSMFLNYLMPACSFDEAVDILTIVKEKWTYAYFSTTHYFVFTGVVLLALVSFLRKNFVLDRSNSLSLALSLVMFVGCLSFGILMLKQYPAHDYYFLDTFYLPLLLIFTFGLTLLPKTTVQWVQGIKTALVVVISIVLFMAAFESQTNRRKIASWNRTSSTIHNFTNSEEFLNSLNISSDAQILVIDAYAPNIPLLLMNRKGNVVMTTYRENIIKALTWDNDYIVIQNEFFLSDIYSVFPEFIDQVTIIGNNGYITVCTKNEADIPQNLNTFLGFDHRTIITSGEFTFENDSSTLWSNTQRTDKTHHNGKHAGMLTSNMEFGLTFKSNEVPRIREERRLLNIQGYFKRDTEKFPVTDIELVVVVNQDSKPILYKSLNLQHVLKLTGTWEKVDLNFELPIVTSDEYELAFYLWNTGKTEIYLDDIKFNIY